jgi:hypothetical protein
VKHTKERQSAAIEVNGVQSNRVPRGVELRFFPLPRLRDSAKERIVHRRYCRRSNGGSSLAKLTRERSGFEPDGRPRGADLRGLLSLGDLRSRILRFLQGRHRTRVHAGRAYRAGRRSRRSTPLAAAWHDASTASGPSSKVPYSRRANRRALSCNSFGDGKAVMPVGHPGPPLMASRRCRQPCGSLKICPESPSALSTSHCCATGILR